MHCLHRRTRLTAVATVFALVAADAAAQNQASGALLERWKDGELEELAPIEVTLPSEGRREGDVVPVRIRASVTDVGTLLVEAVPLRPNKEDEHWRIELSVRGG